MGKNWLKLAASIVIDLIGMSSMIMGIPEVIDWVWAPLSALLIQLMYGKLWFSIIGLAEEALPFTDFIPTATIAWLDEEFNIIKKI